jgi:diadenosine tetraphosphate (Ap4A) HIT family hydrolase
VSLECVFCKLDREIILENEQFMAFFDAYPVTDLHTLIVTKRHIVSFSELNIIEQQALIGFLLDVRAELSNRDRSISAFNIGINDGCAAGQTVMHLHTHVIPRRVGDMDDPKGGVRGVIPRRQRY